MLTSSDLETTSACLDPRSHGNCWGHESAEQEFLRYIKAGKIPHGFLFEGPKGIGKATFAYRVIRFFLYHGLMLPHNVVGLDIDENASVIPRVSSGGHRDLFTLAPTGTKSQGITVDDTRRAIDFFHKKPQEGGWRILLVDTADDLNKNGLNALLKVLEEPPASSLLLLLTTQARGLPRTIQSRCMRLIFKTPPEAVGLRIMTPFVDSKTALPLLRLAENAPGIALYWHNNQGATLYELVLVFMKLAWCREGARSLEVLQKYFDEHPHEFPLWVDMVLRFGGVIINHRQGLYPEESLTSLEQDVLRLAQQHSLGALCALWLDLFSFTKAAAIFHLDWRHCAEAILTSVRSLDKE